jgi:hypothetical protein
MDESVDYCREIEAYLCQKNGGHLVRIVGPAFEKVRDWADQGVPLKVAFRGIDRCCERASARGGRQRPMRVEFCEADVLEAFDDWRRAIGVAGTRVAEPSAPGFESHGEAGATARKGSLAAHIERCVSRLLAPKALAPDPSYDEVVTRITRDLDELAARAKSARGETRARLVQRLAELDGTLVAAAVARVDPGTSAALQAEADLELSGFAGRMPPDSLARTRRLAFERLVREALNLPVLSYE